MITSAIFSDGIHMLQDGVYRGRLVIHAPKMIAGEDTVRSALGDQGFTEVLFFDKNNLPSDWPADQRDDPSSSFQWTAFMQGRFTMTDRVIPVSELGTKVTLLGMWINLPETAPQPRPPVPDATPAPKPDPVLTPSVVTVPVEPAKRASVAGTLFASAAGVAIGFAAGQLLRRKR